MVCIRTGTIEKIRGKSSLRARYHGRRARALFSRPQILVLDEATAALDNETEAAVMEAIDALQGKMTLIIVAHRLSTIRNCDKIYEICNGRAELRKKVDILKG